MTTTTAAGPTPYNFRDAHSLARRLDDREIGTLSSRLATEDAGGSLRAIADIRRTLDRIEGLIAPVAVAP